MCFWSTDATACSTPCRQQARHSVTEAGVPSPAVLVRIADCLGGRRRYLLTSALRVRGGIGPQRRRLACSRPIVLEHGSHSTWVVVLGHRHRPWHGDILGWVTVFDVVSRSRRDIESASACAGEALPPGTVSGGRHRRCDGACGSATGSMMFLARGMRCARARLIPRTRPARPLLAAVNPERSAVARPQAHDLNLAHRHPARRGA